jgi:hypothetical protein
MAFATTDQLGTRLGRTFDASEVGQADALLEDATAYLQREIGAQVTAGSSTITLNVPAGSRLARLPQWPVRSLDSVSINGTASTSVKLVDGGLWLSSGFAADSDSAWSTVEVTYSHGTTEVPADLVAWTCVLAAGVLAQVGRSDTLSPSGVSSEAIEDYSVSYEAGVESMSLPANVLSRLRASYGRGAFVVGSRR